MDILQDITYRIKFGAHSKCVEALMHQVHHDAKLKASIEHSIREAYKIGKAKLNPDLFKALDSIGGWPQSINEYYSYLEFILTYIPHQNSSPAWAVDPSDPKKGYQEDLDMILHFYWLINQPLNDSKATVQDNPFFKTWLKSFARDWGMFLDTTDSFNASVLESFVTLAPKFEMDNYLITIEGVKKPNNPSGWLTFNQFFARELNPGLRPICKPFDNRFIACPADCTYMEQFPINADSDIPQIIMKGTHSVASVSKQLLRGSQYKDAFANGVFVHYFLSTYNYHRFHSSVAGKVVESRAVQENVYLDVTLKPDGSYDAPDQSEGGYEFTQARGIFIVDTTHSPYGNVGLVAVLPIGMAQVSSVNMLATAGIEVLKGDEFGYFMFGGSDIIVLFQQGANPVINTDKTPYRKYGSDIAECSVLHK